VYAAMEVHSVLKMKVMYDAYSITVTVISKY